MTRELGDRISHWCIFNEPWVLTFYGYGYGTDAPGLRDFRATLRAAHVVNIAQGQAFCAIKAINPKFQVGTRSACRIASRRRPARNNFEWAEGFTQRFGLVYVDFRDQRRIIKDSGYWYGKLAASGTLS